jgi:hypothetical protein
VRGCQFAGPSAKITIRTIPATPQNFATRLISILVPKHPRFARFAPRSFANPSTLYPAKSAPTSGSNNCGAFRTRPRRRKSGMPNTSRLSWAWCLPRPGTGTLCASGCKSRLRTRPGAAGRWSDAVADTDRSYAADVARRSSGAGRSAPNPPRASDNGYDGAKRTFTPQQRVRR